MEKSFSDHLKAYKEKNSLTNREMADVLGISERMYAYYEKGDYDGNPAKVKKYLLKLSGNLQSDGNKKGEDKSEFPETSDLKDKYIKLLEEAVVLLKMDNQKLTAEVQELKKKLEYRGSR